jgi:RNA polymerase sigma-70 factor (ECF subfamily)
MDQEQSWITMAKNRDTDAFGRLVEAYQSAVYNLAHRMLGDPYEAEDAAQETFLRAYRHLDRYDPSRKFSTWLFSIASHHCIDRLRRRRLACISLQDEHLPPTVLTSSQPGPEHQACQAEHEADVQDLLDTLPSDYKLAVLLHYWYDLSYQEIADATGDTVSAIKSRLFRARQKLAKTLQEQAATQSVVSTGSEYTAPVTTEAIKASIFATACQQIGLAL